MESTADLNQLGSYDFRLPDELIAQYPVSPRDQSRLMVIDRGRGTVEHRRFLDFPAYFGSEDVLVANNTRVLKARLLGHRLIADRSDGTPELGGKIEFLMLNEERPRVWKGAFHASAKHRPGVRFYVPTPDGRGLRGVLIRGASDSPNGTVEAEFDRDPVESGAGEIPLPHYIGRHASSSDESQYQTLYAKSPGSAAAPTAGFHFTERVMASLRENGALWREVTLNVGLGTFRPVKTDDIRNHVMHEERFEIEPQVAADLTRLKALGTKVTAIGTTSVRTLESAWLPGTSSFKIGTSRTSIFIRPGDYTFGAVDRLLTNFHLPRSTLLILICAFAGRDLVLEAYKQAVRERYRFYSYGDAMLIL